METEAVTIDHVLRVGEERRQGKETFDGNSYPNGSYFETFDYGDKNGILNQDYWEDVPNRRKITYERRRSESYLSGFKTGLTWTDDYRPGGPAVHYYTENDSKEWKQKCLSAQLAREDYLRGFDDGIKERDRLKKERDNENTCGCGQPNCEMPGCRIA